MANIVVLLEKGAVWSAGGLGGGAADSEVLLALRGGSPGPYGWRKAGRGCHGRYAERGRDSRLEYLVVGPGS